MPPIVRFTLFGCVGLLACASGVVASAAVAPRSLPAESPRDATKPRPQLAVAGFELAAGADERDAWLPQAFEEMLAWRLRRVSGLLTVPVVRVHQTRRELQEEGEPPPSWPRVVAAMGPKYMLTGRCSGPPYEATLHLAILEFSSAAGEASSKPSADTRVWQEVDLPPGKLFDVLDAATRWALDQFEIREVPQSVQDMIFGPPCRTPSALEYYARAVIAARAGDLRTAHDYAARSLGYDERFRPTLALMVQLEVQSGKAGRSSAMRLLRQWAELARICADPVDRAAAELGFGAVLHMDGTFDAAYQRYENALAMAYADDSPYGQMLAANSLADLFSSRRLPQQPVLTDAQLRTLAQQDLRAAVAWLEIALDLASGLGDLATEAPCANKLALTYERLGEWEAAIAMHQRSLAAAQRIGARQSEAAAWLCLAQGYQRASKPAEALAAAQRALPLANPALQPMVRIVIGAAYRILKQPEAALAEYEQAYRELRETDDLGSQLACVTGVADLRMQLGRRAEAISALQEAIEIAHALSATQEEASLREQLANWNQNVP